jgi:hypothetical protein
MSYLSYRPEQSTQDEIDLVTNLGNIAVSGAGQFIRKVGLFSFANATPADLDISAVWGSITGTLSDQTDLQDQFNLKASSIHNHLDKVPYTGATTDVDLGAHDLTLDNIVFNGGIDKTITVQDEVGTNGADLLIKGSGTNSGFAGSITVEGGFATSGARGGNVVISGGTDISELLGGDVIIQTGSGGNIILNQDLGAGRNVKLDLLAVTTVRTLTIQDITGTVALLGQAELQTPWNQDINAQAFKLTNFGGFLDSGSALTAILDTATLASDQTFTFPNATGTIALAETTAPLVHDHTTADGTGPLTGDEHDTFSNYVNSAIPGTPDADNLRLSSFKLLTAKPRMIVTDEDAINLTLNRDNVFTVQAGEDLVKGDVVYITGVASLFGVVSKFIADGSITKAPIGIMAETVTSGNLGYVMTMGIMGLVNSLTASQEIWASSTVAGALTSTEPSHPNLKVRMGFCIVTGAFGLIEVEPLIVRGDHEGTRLNTWKIGDNTAGAKSITLRNGFDMVVSGNPSAARALTIPDTDGTLVVGGGTASGTNTGDQFTSVVASRLLGRGSAGGTGIAEVITLGTNLSMSGTTLNATGGGSVSMTEVEIDVGTTPVLEKTVNVVDAGVLATSKILGGVANIAPTGKDLDEVEADALELKFQPQAGSININIKGLEGAIADKFKLWYTFA